MLGDKSVPNVNAVLNPLKFSVFVFSVFMSIARLHVFSPKNVSKHAVLLHNGTCSGDSETKTLFCHAVIALKLHLP